MGLITRRLAMQGGLTAGTRAAIRSSPLAALTYELSAGRRNLSGRLFSSPAIEAAVAGMKHQIADPVLGAMFERCFPNTLDTTVFPGKVEGKPITRFCSVFAIPLPAQVLCASRSVTKDPSQFTRAWFAWANTLFDELLLKLANTKPSLLKHVYRRNS